MEKVYNKYGLGTLTFVVVVLNLIFPKLFYTHLIRDLHQFANETTIDITNVDSVQIKMHKEVSSCAVQ